MKRPRVLAEVHVLHSALEVNVVSLVQYRRMVARVLYESENIVKTSA